MVAATSLCGDASWVSGEGEGARRRERERERGERGDEGSGGERDIKEQSEQVCIRVYWCGCVHGSLGFLCTLECSFIVNHIHRGVDSIGH